MKKNGYTLVEIVIVLAIIILMALVSMPAFGKYNLSNNFDTKAEEVVSLFNKAYLLSKSPPRVMDVTGTKEFVCDTADVRRTGSQLIIYLKRTLANGAVVDCKTGNAPDDSMFQLVEVNDNPSLDVLSISNLAPNYKWRFSTDSVNLGPGDGRIEIASTKLGKSVNIVLEANQNTFTIKRN